MHGVVLWSDTAKNQAVIWCDDHGDLAFYKSPERDREFMAFHAGDLVEFQVEDTGALRIASCPRVVAKESYPSLTTDLRQAGEAMGVLRDICEEPDRSADASGVKTAEIVPFQRRPLDEVA